MRILDTRCEGKDRNVARRLQSASTASWLPGSPIPRSVPGNSHVAMMRLALPDAWHCCCA